MTTTTTSPRALADVSKSLYRTGPWLARKFLHWRPYICPFDRLIQFVPRASRVLDVGCGGGLFLGLLTALDLAPDGTGFDSAEPAIDLARQMAGGNRAEGRMNFLRLDAQAEWPEGTYDVVALIDVIHHVPVAAQRAVVARAGSRVRPGGILLYKDISPRPLWRATMNRLHDLVVARQWVNYISAADASTWAGAEGLHAEHAEHIDRLWYGHDLIVFRRPVREGSERP